MLPLVGMALSILSNSYAALSYKAGTMKNFNGNIDHYHCLALDHWICRKRMRNL